MDDTMNHQEHSHSGTVTVEKQQQQPCIDCPGSQTTVMVQREFTTLGISANIDTSVLQGGY